VADSLKFMKNGTVEVRKWCGNSTVKVQREYGIGTMKYGRLVWSLLIPYTYTVPAQYP